MAPLCVLRVAHLRVCMFACLCVCVFVCLCVCVFACLRVVLLLSPYRCAKIRHAIICVDRAK
jgi:hypothetical protein